MAAMDLRLRGWQAQQALSQGRENKFQLDCCDNFLSTRPLCGCRYAEGSTGATGHLFLGDEEGKC